MGAIGTTDTKEKISEILNNTDKLLEEIETITDDMHNLIFGTNPMGDLANVETPPTCMKHALLIQRDKADRIRGKLREIYDNI